MSDVEELAQLLYGRMMALAKRDIAQILPDQELDFSSWKDQPEMLHAVWREIADAAIEWMRQK